MYRYALTRLGDRHLAEDAVQETFIAIIGKAAAEDAKTPRSARAWLFGILKHKVVDLVRARARDGKAAADLENLVQGGIHCPGHHSGPQVQSEADAAETRLVLHAAIQQLPEKMRQVFCFRVLDGMSTEEVCRVLSITPTNMWVLVHRAKQRLHAALAAPRAQTQDEGASCSSGQESFGTS